MLAATLNSLTALIIPRATTWEVLVINNNCTDDTDGVVSTFSDKLPIRTTHEPAQGLSNARNRAISEAKGEYILWTDDDVLPASTWITSYLNAFNQAPQAAFWGGAVTPQFKGTPPPWLHSHWRLASHAFAVRDLPEDMIASPDSLPYGANYAVRSAIQRKYPYDPALGRHGHCLAGGEEVAVLSKLLADRYEGRWVKHADVVHIIPKERQSLGYIFEFYYAAGMAQGRSAKVSNLTIPRIFGKPRWLFRALLESHLLYAFFRLFRSPKRWLPHFIRSSRFRGYFSSS